MLQEFGSRRKHPRRRSARTQSQRSGSQLAAAALARQQSSARDARNKRKEARATQTRITRQRLESAVATRTQEYGGEVQDSSDSDEPPFTPRAASTSTHSEVTCKECGKLCKSRTGLQRHMVVHSKHVCRNCDASFSNATGLLAHRASSHSIAQEDIVEVLDDSDSDVAAEGQAFQCDYCPKSFSSKYALNGHHVAMHIRRRDAPSPSGESASANYFDGGGDDGPQFAEPSATAATDDWLNDDNVFECSICFVQFDDSFKLAQHVWVHGRAASRLTDTRPAPPPRQQGLGLGAKAMVGLCTDLFVQLV